MLIFIIGIFFVDLNVINYITFIYTDKIFFSLLTDFYGLLSKNILIKNIVMHYINVSLAISLFIIYPVF